MFLKQVFRVDDMISEVSCSSVLKEGDGMARCRQAEQEWDDPEVTATSMNSY